MKIITNVLYVDHWGCRFPHDAMRSRHQHIRWDDEANQPETFVTYNGTKMMPGDLPVTMEDASIDHHRKWEVYKRDRANRARIRVKWEERKKLKEDARALLISNYQIIAQMKRELGSRYEPVTRMTISFLESRLKSSFKKSLALQVLEWLNEPNRRKMYKCPLTRKQLAVIDTQPTRSRYR